MMARKTAFEKIQEGLSEALEVAKGKVKPAKIFIPPEIDVRTIRRRRAIG